MQYHTDAFQQPSSKYNLNAYLTLEAEEEEEKEDFQTVPYPCPYSDYQASSYNDTLDLSGISEFEDLMTTSSDEDIPALKDVGY